MSPGSDAVEGVRGGWSYGDLDAATDELAARLTGLGLGAGRIGALLLWPSRAATMTVHAIPRTGAVIAPASPSWTEPELLRFLEALRPEAAVHAGGTELPSGGGYETCDTVELRGAGPVSISVPAAPRDRADEGELIATHSVLWTSGTDGVPRAVQLTLDNHLFNARGAIRRLRLDAADRWLASLSLAHVGGLATILRAAVCGSCVVTTGQGFAAAQAAGLLANARLTHASLVPTMLRELLEVGELASPPEGLRALLIGGDAARPDLITTALEAGLPIALTYGLTEAASQVATAPPDLVRRKPGTVGRPLRGVEVRIGSKEEVLVRGPTVMAGYLGGPAEPDPAAWLPTGDAGRLDADGDLWITGRLSDRIVTGGVNVDPREVEAVLVSHPGVRDAAVVGTPDERWGERLTAVVCPAPDVRIEQEELERFVRERLSGPRRPRIWIVDPEIPRTAAGKVDRRALRLRVADRRTGGSAGTEDGA